MNRADAAAAIARLDDISRAIDYRDPERVLILAREAYDFGRALCQTLADTRPDDPDLADAINGMAFYFETIATAVLVAQGWTDAERR